MKKGGRHEPGTRRDLVVGTRVASPASHLTARKSQDPHTLEQRLGIQEIQDTINDLNLHAMDRPCSSDAAGHRRIEIIVGRKNEGIIRTLPPMHILVCLLPQPHICDKQQKIEQKF